jgi:hypothetical protein
MDADSMSNKDTTTELTHTATGGAIAADQQQVEPRPVLVGPTTAKEFNTIGERLIPKGCFRFEDVRFAFDSSFILPGVAKDMPHLADLRERHSLTRDGEKIPPPLSIFGHADPVGNDDYNKQLSGRRAQAVYGMLVRDWELWDYLFRNPYGGDNWGNAAIQIMLTKVNPPPEPPDGAIETQNQDAVKTFQAEQGLTADGIVGPITRNALYLAYMNALCGSLRLDKKKDFLAHNKDDPGGKGDYQGCSEFNPVRMFSQEENARYEQDPDKTQRNLDNQPNRRVMVLLFAPGRRVNPQFWPCPRAKEGITACKKRFFPDAAQRRSFQEKRREFAQTKDTFACRFYQLITDDSPCEGVVHVASGTLIVKALRQALRLLVPDAEISIQGPVNLTQATGSSTGVAQFRNIPTGLYSIRAAHPLLCFDKPVEIRLASGEIREATVELYQEISLRLLTYNVFMMSWVYYNSGQMERAAILPHYLGPEEDVIIFNELFWSSPREALMQGIAARYPRQSSLVTRWEDPENGGVMIVGAARNGFQDGGHHIFDVSSGVDGLAAKGVKHVSIHKQGYNFHIFGTHTQANDGETEAVVRVQQFQQILAFIREKIRIGHIRPLSPVEGSPLEPIIIGGDMNVNRYGPEFSGMIANLNTEPPQIYSGHGFTWDPTTNDLAFHFWPTDTPQYYDYLLPCKLGLLPHTSQVTTVINRTPEPWRVHEDAPNSDLSDHYALRGEFVYRF